jgi:hypothetical protein
MSNKESLWSTFKDLIDALKKNDEQKLNELILADYQGFSLRGTIEYKKTILQNFKPGCIRLSKYILENVEYEVFGHIGIVSGKGTIAGNYGEHEFEHQVLFTDIFKYCDEHWRYYKSQVTEIH